MKYLLNGVAIAAALAFATPVWAQAPMTPSAGKPAAAAPAPKMAAKQMHHRRPMRHMRMARHHHMMRMAPGDEMTEQLNREELSRLQGGMPPPPPPPGGGAGQGGPRASGH